MEIDIEKLKYELAKPRPYPHDRESLVAIESLESALAQSRAEAEAAKHDEKVTKSFHDVAVAERNAAWHENEVLTQDLNRAKQACSDSSDIALDFERQVVALTAELEKLRGMARWIPVSERLPEDGQNMIADYRPYNDPTAKLEVHAAKFQDGEWLDGKGGILYTLENWMPMPSPANQSHQAATPECGCGMPPNMRVCLGPHNDAPMDHQAATQDQFMYRDCFDPLTLEDAKAKGVCRICRGANTSSAATGPFVYHFGTEYAHQKCLDRCDPSSTQDPAPGAWEKQWTTLVQCAAGRDGDCNHPACPQNREGEPMKTGRHCPLDTDHEDDDL